MFRSSCWKEKSGGCASCEDANITLPNRLQYWNHQTEQRTSPSWSIMSMARDNGPKRLINPHIFRKSLRRVLFHANKFEDPSRFQQCIFNTDGRRIYENSLRKCRAYVYSVSHRIPKLEKLSSVEYHVYMENLHNQLHSDDRIFYWRNTYILVFFLVTLEYKGRAAVVASFSARKNQQM